MVFLREKVMFDPDYFQLVSSIVSIPCDVHANATGLWLLHAVCLCKLHSNASGRFMSPPPCPSQSEVGGLVFSNRQAQGMCSQRCGHREGWGADRGSGVFNVGGSTEPPKTPGGCLGKGPNGRGP